MSEHVASVRWQRGNEAFAQGRYSRRHEWHFDGGTVVTASPSPLVVPAPWSDAQGVDPEEAFVAAISSCHMLWFLSLAADRGFVVDQYADNAVGKMTRIAPQRHAITDVVLRPAIVYAPGCAPDADSERALHQAAHERCFIANSVKTAIRIESPDAGQRD